MLKQRGGVPPRCLKLKTDDIKTYKFKRIICYKD